MGTIGLGRDCVEEVVGCSGAKTLEICSTLGPEADTASDIRWGFDEYLQRKMKYKILRIPDAEDMRPLRALNLQSSGCFEMC